MITLRTEFLFNGIESLFDLDADYAMKQKQRALDKVIDRKTGKIKISRNTTLEGAMLSVGKRLSSAFERYKLDDEPLSASELEQLKVAYEDIAAGRVYSFE